LEVTEATDKSLRDALGARAAKVPGAVLPAPGLRRSWHLYPTARTRFAALGGCIPLLARLERSGATERHLLVWVDIDNAVPWQDLDRGQLPVALPTLPPAMTTVWVATTGSHGGPILWRARLPDAWEQVLP
jgi:hypothetical protein